ncbi:MAG TPA: exodeoxyribonuclease VII small subunit [Holosporales bacterium]|nr:exodeoxyribonuclease VII small subunit [Holosporales bacterium]
MADKKPQDMNFEEAMTELEQVVRQLEDGRVPLEQAIGSYERGAALKARCESLLKEARLTVEEIYKSKEGSVDVKPSDLQALVDGPQ